MSGVENIVLVNVTMSLHAALYDSLSSAGFTGLVVWVVSVPGLDDASWASAGAPNDSRAGEG